MVFYDGNYRQQTPPSLTFARPWVNPHLGMDQEFRIFDNIIATPQKYTYVQTRIFLRIRINQSDF